MFRFIEVYKTKRGKKTWGFFSSFSKAFGHILDKCLGTFKHKDKPSVLLMNLIIWKEERDGDAAWKVACWQADPALAHRGTAILSCALWQHKACSPGPEKKEWWAFKAVSVLSKFWIAYPPSEHPGDCGVCGNSWQYLFLPGVTADHGAAFSGKRFLSSHKSEFLSPYIPLQAIYTK